MLPFGVGSDGVVGANTSSRVLLLLMLFMVLAKLMILLKMVDKTKG